MDGVKHSTSKHSVLSVSADTPTKKTTTKKQLKKRNFAILLLMGLNGISMLLANFSIIYLIIYLSVHDYLRNLREDIMWQNDL